MAAIPGDLPPGLLPSDEWLLRLVLEGHVDADIGAEFGLSAGEARQRIALLAAKLDVNGREGLVRRFGASATAGASASARRGPFRRAWLVAAGAGLALAAVGTVSVLAVTRGGSSTAAPDAARHAAVAAAISATASAQVAAENPGGWLDLGPFIVVAGSANPIYSTSQRAIMTVVTMAGPGVIPLQGTGAQWTKSPSNPPGLAELFGSVGDAPVHIVLRADANTRLISDPSGVVRVYSVSAAANPVLLIEARVGVGAGADPNRRTVYVSPSGRLFLSPAPVPPDAAIDQSTGAALDLSHTTKLGDVGGGVAVNICNGDLSHDNGGSCSLVWSAASRPFISPVAGTVRCLASGPIEFEGSTFRLRFLSGGGPTPDCTADPGRVVPSGDVVVPAGKYYITATTNDPYVSAAKQLPLSVVMAGSTLYVGPIHLTAGCPCLGGN